MAKEAIDTRHYDVIVAPHITERRRFRQRAQRGGLQVAGKPPPSRRSRRRWKLCSMSR